MGAALGIFCAAAAYQLYRFLGQPKRYVSYWSPRSPLQALKDTEDNRTGAGCEEATNLPAQSVAKDMFLSSLGNSMRRKEVSTMHRCKPNDSKAKAELEYVPEQKAKTKSR